MASAFLVRFLVALWGHSGEHSPPMYGDFEAHRHWMEITTNVPIGDWYRNTIQNDLNYWGLDYPPLMAYMSWIWGKASELVVPGMVELGASRGKEDPETKAFMRLTVLLGDCLVLIPLMIILSRHRYSHLKTLWKTPLVPLVSLLAPALVLIDHGHFQYNGLCIVLALAGASLIVRDQDIAGSICFCLSLNLKQMALYYAPVFFCALLRKCWLKPTLRQRVGHFCAIGFTVIATFAVLWLPFCLLPGDGQSCTSGLLAVLSRQFPFSRGIFEDKVANLWYALSVVWDYRTLLPLSSMVSLSLALTLTLLSPVCYLLLTRTLSWPHVCLAMVNSALAYFLASFQVHEKSILLALVPAANLALLDADFCLWLEVVGCFTLFPLLRRDGLVVPYLALIPLYVVLMDELGSQIRAMAKKTDEEGKSRAAALLPFQPPWQAVPAAQESLRLLRLLGYVCMVALHIAEAWVSPPARYPDLYPALFALFGAGNFLLAYLQGICWQFSVSQAATSQTLAAEKNVLGKFS